MLPFERTAAGGNRLPRICAPRPGRHLAPLVLAALLTAVATTASAQFALRSKIAGTITDSTGAALPGATVTLTETSRNQVLVATTDASGAYTFTNITSGVYTVSAELSGFVKAVSEPLPLGSSTSSRIDLQLHPGLSETVEGMGQPYCHRGWGTAGVGGAGDSRTGAPDD